MRRGQLSPADTLGLQGGPVPADEPAASETLPHAADAVPLRRWDDLAKDATHEPSPFEHFLPVLRGLRSGCHEPELTRDAAAQLPSVSRISMPAVPLAGGMSRGTGVTGDTGFWYGKTAAARAR